MKLDRKTLRLIAVGASVSANCQPCLQINTEKAREGGADEGEIGQAIEVGRMVREGAASKMDAFAAGLAPAASAGATAADQACACTEQKASAS
jgi:AhpD family alkylhydroperoxidase